MSLELLCLSVLEIFFSDKVTVILDCFEIFTEGPSGMLNQSLMYSNYKHQNTVNYFIGISPQGVITFVSKGWEGRASDKYITEKCGILENLLPGDILMVDRGFNIRDDVSFLSSTISHTRFYERQKTITSC